MTKQIKNGNDKKENKKVNHCQTCQTNYNLGDITSRVPVPLRPPVCFTLTWPPVHIAATWSLVLHIFLSVAEMGSLACLAGSWLSGRVSISAVGSHRSSLVLPCSILTGKQMAIGYKVLLICSHYPLSIQVQFTKRSPPPKWQSSFRKGF